MATGAVWENVPGQGLVLRDAGASGLHVGMMLPGNVDGEHFAATGNMRIAGTEGEGTPAQSLQGYRPMTYGFPETAKVVERTVENADGSHTTFYTDGTSERVESPETSDPDLSPSQNMQSAFYTALREAGMDKTAIDGLWKWAETELVNDPSFTAERALIGMYDSEAFKQRFPGIANMPAGSREIPTPGEYIAFEKDVANELKRVGVVEANFNNLITSLYMNSVGIGEVTERLNAAQRVMYEMPPAVRDKLTDWFGDEYGTSITMKTFLDPGDDWSAVQDDISTAQTGGWGRMVAGLDAGWDENLAKKVSDLGLSQAEQWNRFAQLKEREMLFTENIDEVVDLDYATEGVEAAFDLDDNDLSETIERRAIGRSAKFSGGGGALLSGTTTGFGAANA
jgi:hypothetical protein